MAKKNGHKESELCLVVDGYKRLVLDVGKKELIKLTRDSLQLCAFEVGLSAGTEVREAEAMDIASIQSRNLLR